MASQSPGSIRTVLFDLGNVLVRFSHDRMIRQLALLAGCEESAMRQWAFEQDAYHRLESGEWCDDDFCEAFVRLAGKDIPADAIHHAGADIFTDMPLMPAVVAQLAQSNVRLVLLSNTCAAHFRFVRERYSHLQHFHAYILSYEVKSRKPEPAIYQAALKAIDCAPHECVYFDDVADNIAAAVPFELQTRLFTTPEQCIADLQQLGVRVD